MVDETQEDQEFLPAQEYLISDLDTLKVAAEPMRLRILEVLSEHPLTVKQVARRLDTTPTRLYYHVNLLEEHGLITVTASRIVSGIIEKQYRTSAHRLRVSRELLTVSGDQTDGSVDAILSAVFDATRDDVLKSLHEGIIKLGEDPKVSSSLLMRTITRFTSEQYRDFRDRLDALLNEYDILTEDETATAGNRSASSIAYGVTIAVYPAVEPEVGDEGDEKEE